MTSAAVANANMMSRAMTQFEHRRPADFAMFIVSSIPFNDTSTSPTLRGAISLLRDAGMQGRLPRPKLDDFRVLHGSSSAALIDPRRCTYRSTRSVLANVPGCADRLAKCRGTHRVNKTAPSIIPCKLPGSASRLQMRDQTSMA